MRRPLHLLLILSLFAGGTLLAMPSARGSVSADGWSEKTLELAATLPIQDEGRVKPLSTYARFSLLATSGKTKVKIEDNGEEHKISALEFVLDCMFRPERARTYPVILVEDWDVLADVGLADALEGRKKRDRYSYDEILPSAESGKLQEKFEVYRSIPARDQSSVQLQVVRLHQNLVLLHNLLGAPSMRTGEGTTAGSMALIPPPGSAAVDKVWLTPDVLARRAMADPADYRPQLSLLETLRELGGLVGEPSKFEEKFEVLHSGVVSLAESRGEYDKIGLEVTYYQSHFYHWALGFFMIGFVLVAVGWMVPQGKWLYRITPVPLWIAAAALSVGITLRCIIRERPPVTTLYETILFITAVAAISALVIEHVSRRKIAMALAAILGAGGVFLANKYEVSQGVDTMPQLVAVLDTNFWLSTHVTTIAIGYAAGLLCAAVAHVYLLGRLFGFRKGDEAFYRYVARMIYGIAAFTLIFSVVGTLLGGVWADYSWGRFWGWDPKENGALMICLWFVAMIHAQIGGYIRDLGLAMAAVFGGIVVAFSWWGVNLLGVGLHTYGFTAGILRSLVGFGILEAIVMLTGVVIYLRDGPGRRTPRGGEEAPAPSLDS